MRRIEFGGSAAKLPGNSSAQLAACSCTRKSYLAGRATAGAAWRDAKVRLYAGPNPGSVPRHADITAILEPHADGTLHLPLPAGLPRGKVKVTATIENSEAPVTAEAIEERMHRIRAAFQILQEHGTFKTISDPVAWQREIRQDRPLPGRD